MQTSSPVKLKGNGDENIHKLQKSHSHAHDNPNKTDCEKSKRSKQPNKPYQYGVIIGFEKILTILKPKPYASDQTTVFFRTCSASKNKHFV